MVAVAAAGALLAGCSSTGGTTAGSASTTAAGGNASAAATAGATAVDTAVASAAALPTPDAVNGSVTIGVTFSLIDEFIQTVADGITSEGKKLGVKVNIVQANEQTDTQLSQVENFVSQGVQAIVVEIVDPTTAEPMTQAAQAAHIPIIYVNRKPSTQDAGVPYVGSDAYIAGSLEMTQLAKDAGGKGNVVILEGDPSNEAAISRTKACNDIVAKNPGMKVTKTQAANWYRDKAQTIMENWLQTGEEIDVVCANNDEMALGAINAIKAAGKKLGVGGILVGGNDATADGQAAIRDGSLDATAYQNGPAQGSQAIDAAVDLIQHKTVPAYVDVAYQLIDKANIDQVFPKK